MKRKLFAAVLLASFILTGCGGSAVSKTPLPPADLGTPAPQRESYDFIFVCPIIDNEYWADCIAGIEQADKELGTKTRVIGPQTADNFAVEIIDYMKEAVDAEPDGIMAYSGIAELFPLIDEAGERGIPVLSAGSDAPDTSRIAFIGTAPYTAGNTAGKAMIELTGGTAKIGYLCSSFSAEKEKLIFDIFSETISDYDMEVVAVGEGMADADYSTKATETMLEEHPEITAIFCTAGYNVTGAARVKKAQGLDDLVLLGPDDVDENLAFVREGVIDAIYVQAPYQIGYQGVYLLKEYIETGKLASDTYDTGTILVTKDNVDTYKD